MYITSHALGFLAPNPEAPGDPNDARSWKGRHTRALSSAPTLTLQSAVARLAAALADYAFAHRVRFGSEIEEDYVLGPEFAAMVDGLRGLLNGETGELDCGTLDGALLALRGGE
jgi:hypothetical protein